MPFYRAGSKEIREQGMKTVLLIDDSDTFRESASAALMAAEYDVLEARCPDEAFKILELESVDIIVCDLHMPFCLDERRPQFEESTKVGVRTIRELMEVFPDKPIIAMTASLPFELEMYRAQLDDVPTFSKPSNCGELLRIVEQCLDLPAWIPAH